MIKVNLVPDAVMKLKKAVEGKLSKDKLNKACEAVGQRLAGEVKSAGGSGVISTRISMERDLFWMTRISIDHASWLFHKGYPAADTSRNVDYPSVLLTAAKQSAENSSVFRNALK